MTNELIIEEQYIVGEKTFYSKEDAQEYIDAIKAERSQNEFHETVYYENWTTDGEEAERKVVHAQWQTYQEALDDMQNHANSWRPPGTGWIVKVTINLDEQNRIHIQQDKVYENS